MGQSAEINGQSIWFEDSGGDGPAVILSHGFLMDHEMFEHQVAALFTGVPCHHVGRTGFRADGPRRQPVQLLGQRT